MRVFPVTTPGIRDADRVKQFQHPLLRGMAFHAMMLLQYLAYLVANHQHRV